MITNKKIIKDLIKRLYKKSGSNYALDFRNNCVRYKMQALYITDLGMFNKEYLEEYSYFNIIEVGYEKILNKDTSKMAVLDVECIRLINDDKYLSLYNLDTGCYTELKMEYINKLTANNIYDTDFFIFKQTYNSHDLVYIYGIDNKLLAIISPYIRK
jgi:hypothetical protein